MERIVCAVRARVRSQRLHLLVLECWSGWRARARNKGEYRWQSPWLLVEIWRRLTVISKGDPKSSAALERARNAKRAKPTGTEDGQSHAFVLRPPPSAIAGYVHLLEHALL